MARKLSVLLIALLLTLPSTVLAGVVRPVGTGEIEGYLIGINDMSIEIEEYDGTTHKFDYNVNTVFMIDRRVTTRADFKIGMEVYAKYRNMSITSIEGFSTVNTGYIAPGSKVRTGTVHTIDRNQIILELFDGTRETYFTTPAAIVTKNGTNVHLSTLYEGDRVRVYFDEIDTALISRIQIEGDSVIVNEIYKGVLQTADIFNDTLTLTGVEVYRNGEWQAFKSACTFAFPDNPEAFVGGVRVYKNQFKYYTGKTVYLAVSSRFGKQRIERIVIKNQYESLYSEKINSINWYTGAMELSNNKNLTFNEGTIIVRNGRMADPYSLKADMDAFIAADGKGSGGMANIIYIYNEYINNSNIGEAYIYAGRLDEIVKGTVVLNNFFLLAENEWESFDEDKELYYDEDTYIYDIEKDQAITSEQFYSGNYAVDESTSYAKDNALEDCYAYIFADGDRIAAIAVKKELDSLAGQRVTNGIIGSIADSAAAGWTAELVNAADWSAAKERWMDKAASTSINIDKALIIKDGSVIPQNEIRPGDRVFMVRDGYYVKILIIK